MIKPDNWEMVEDAFNLFKHEVSLYREYSGFDTSDAWLMGWCLAQLEWINADKFPEKLKRKICAGIDEARMMGRRRTQHEKIP